jgi:hypothetical protein
MTNKTKVFTSLMLFIIVPALALSIASLVIADQYRDITCDGAIMPLPIWLTVYGSISLAMVILLVASTVWFIKEYSFGFSMYIIMLTLYQLFTVAWNIVGSIALFRDSMPCLHQAQAIWIMVIIVLIVQWIGILHSIFTAL